MDLLRLEAEFIEIVAFFPACCSQTHFILIFRRYFLTLFLIVKVQTYFHCIFNSLLEHFLDYSFILLIIFGLADLALN